MYLKVARQEKIPIRSYHRHEAPKERWDSVRLLLQEEGKGLDIVVLLTNVVQAPGQNKNRVMHVATGGVISLIDVGDEMNPSRIQLLTAAIVQNPALKLETRRNGILYLDVPLTRYETQKELVNSFTQLNSFPLMGQQQV